MNAKTLRTAYGPTALVTGASEGIGAAFARELGKAGFDLVLSARRRDALEALAADITGKHGVKVSVLALDLTGSAASAELAAAARQHDIGPFVAAAGFGTSGEFLNTKLSDELAMIDLNCRAVTEQSRMIAELMVERGRGGIVLMSSMLAFQGVAKATNYAATKAFVQVLAEGTRLELEPKGVDVIACAPGPVSSGFAARANMQMSSAVPAKAIPRPTLRALGKRTTARPGLLTKILSYSLATLPRGARSSILTDAMDKMTRHQDAEG